MGSLEKRYAEALLSLTENSAQADEVGMTLGGLGKVFLQNANLREFILNPSVPYQARVETLADIVDMLRRNGEADVRGENGAARGGAYDVAVAGDGGDSRAAAELLSRFLRLLLDKGRLAFLPTIADEYEAIKADRRNILRVTVRSAAPLDEQTIERFREKYRERYGASDAEVINLVEPSLLGGVSVQIGDVRVDDTLYGRLASLARTIAAGASLGMDESE